MCIKNYKATLINVLFSYQAWACILIKYRSTKIKADIHFVSLSSMYTFFGRNQNCITSWTALMT